MAVYEHQPRNLRPWAEDAVDDPASAARRWISGQPHVTPGEAAYVLGDVSRQTVHNLVGSGYFGPMTTMTGSPGSPRLIALWKLIEFRDAYGRPGESPLPYRFKGGPLTVDEVELGASSTDVQARVLQAVEDGQGLADFRSGPRI